MGSTVDREVVLEQGEAGSDPARLDFLTHFFPLCFKSEGWCLCKKKFTNNILSTTFPLFLYFSLRVKQVAKLTEWCRPVH